MLSTLVTVQFVVDIKSDKRLDKRNIAEMGNVALLTQPDLKDQIQNSTECGLKRLGHVRVRRESIRFI